MLHFLIQSSIDEKRTIKFYSNRVSNLLWVSGTEHNDLKKKIQQPKMENKTTNVGVNAMLTHGKWQLLLNREICLSFLFILNTPKTAALDVFYKMRNENEEKG